MFKVVRELEKFVNWSKLPNFLNWFQRNSTEKIMFEETVEIFFSNKNSKKTPSSFSTYIMIDWVSKIEVNFFCW